MKNIVIFLFLTFFVNSIWGQAPGNTCATAVSLTLPAIGSSINTGVQTTCGRGNNVLSGFSSVNASYGGGEDGYYSITVPAGGGNYTFTYSTTTGHATWKILSIHSGCAPTTTNTVGGFVTGSATGGTVTLNLNAGTYILVIDTWPSPNCGQFNLTITRNTPPLLGCTNGSLFASLTPTCNGSQQTISTCNWAGEYNNLTLTSGIQYTFGSSISTDFLTITTNTGTIVASGTQPLNYTPTSSGVYRVYIHTNSSCGTQSGCRLTWVQCGTIQPPPPNDACSNATPLPCGTSNLAGTTVNSVSETAPSGCASQFGVWYTFTGNGQSTTISSSASFDHELTIVSGNCSSLTNVACVDNSTGTETYTFTTINGLNYYVYVAHFSTTSSTTGTFNISRTCTNAENVVPFTGNNSYTTCSGILYDHGGSAGNYGNNANGFTVLTPSTSGTVIQLTGNIDTEFGYDFVTIYNGVGTANPVLWQGSGVQNIGTVTSTVGALTVQFTSDGSVSYTGFALNINCVTPTNGPCTNINAFAVENMPTQSNPVVTISCPGVGQYTDEYSEWLNGVAGITYITSSSITSDWITIRSGTPNGSVVAFGSSPLTWTAPTTGTYFIHVNTNGFCGSDLLCRNITVQRISPLPISLLSYDVELQYDNVYVDWSTLTETNNEYFFIERSADAVNFERIGIIKGAGTTNETNIYQYIDISPLLGVSYYRIKQIDFDGTFTYTEIKSVNNQIQLLEQDVLIYPNPLRNQLLNIRVISIQEEDIQIDIIDSKGKFIKQFSFSSKIGYNEISLNMDRITSGIYSVIVKSEQSISNHILIISN